MLADQCVWLLDGDEIQRGYSGSLEGLSEGNQVISLYYEQANSGSKAHKISRSIIFERPKGLAAIPLKIGINEISLWPKLFYLSWQLMLG